MTRPAGSGSDRLETRLCFYEGCAPGTLWDFGTMVYGLESISALGSSAVIGDVIYSDVFFTGELTFRGPSMILPSSGYPADGVDELAAGPFTFEGRISVYADPTRSGAPLFSLHLVGSGVVWVGFYLSQDRVYDDYIHFHFEP